MAILGPKTCLGIDIGVRDIRVVELRRTAGKPEVTQAARISIPESGDVSAALSGFLLDTETSPGRVVGSLPTHLCSVKLAQVPKAKPADLARMVRFEAESQIPLPLSDVVWDYSAECHNGDPMCHVVIGGARRSDVEQTLGALERANLSPDALMVSALAALMPSPCRRTSRFCWCTSVRSGLTSASCTAIGFSRTGPRESEATT